MIYLLLVAWFSTGMAGFAFWWTTHYDLTTGEIPLLTLTGLVGPFSWVIGYFIHGTRDHTAVLMKKRHNAELRPLDAALSRPVAP